jgi:hypothetical protein
VNIEFQLVLDMMMLQGLELVSINCGHTNVPGFWLLRPEMKMAVSVPKFTSK